MSRAEERLIDSIDRQAAKPLKAGCTIRLTLDQAYRAYANRYGWPEAKGWAAARAHYKPEFKPANDARAEAEALFGEPPCS